MIRVLASPWGDSVPMLLTMIPPVRASLGSGGKATSDSLAWYSDFQPGFSNHLHHFGLPSASIACLPS